MPSFEQPIENNQIIVFVGVSESARWQGRQVFRALLDTGATVTSVSPRVAADLGLTATGVASVDVASGDTVSLPRFRAWIDIPVAYNAADQSGQRSFFWGADRTVVGLPFQPANWDVLLGMDLIGLFHITMYNNRPILSN